MVSLHCTENLKLPSFICNQASVSDIIYVCMTCHVQYSYRMRCLSAGGVPGYCPLDDLLIRGRCMTSIDRRRPLLTQKYIKVTVCILFVSSLVDNPSLIITYLEQYQQQQITNIITISVLAVKVLF